MAKIFWKGPLKWTIACVTLISISFIGLTGCKSADSSNNMTIGSGNISTEAKSTVGDTTKDSNITDSKNEISGTEKYIKLIGQSKDNVIQEINENPVSIDEGGLEFKKAGIRVWFKDYGNGLVVSQIFTQNKDINFNGAKIGDKISSFKKALGNPISDRSGEAHFKYNSVFLSINYDTQTEDTVCVYFLKENYQAKVDINRYMQEFRHPLRIHGRFEHRYCKMTGI